MFKSMEGYRRIELVCMGYTNSMKNDRRGDMHDSYLSNNQQQYDSIDGHDDGGRDE